MSERALAAQREAARLAADIAAGIRDAIVISIPGMMRLACILAAALAVVDAGPKIHAAYGGDAAGLLPAAAITITPIAAALAFNWGWGGLLAAGVVVLAIGYALPQADIVIRSLVVTAVIGLAVLAHIAQRRSEDEQQV